MIVILFSCSSDLRQTRTGGKIDRNGPPNILVSRSSATCGFVDTDPSVTFPIDATHSDMVKFRRGSRYYHTVVSKLTAILDLLPMGANRSSQSQAHAEPYSASPTSIGRSTSILQASLKSTLRGRYPKIFKLLSADGGF
jgi:hypothetical protein